MICSQLTTIGLSERALLVGARMDEFDFHPEYAEGIREYQRGKELVIEDMSCGGGGFLYNNAALNIEMGASVERGDLTRLLQWQANLANCKLDKAQGRVS